MTTNKSINFTKKIYISSFASVAGKKEYDGPLGNLFDRVFEDDMCGEDSFEKAESRLQEESAKIALKKLNVADNAIDIMFAGDLLNQCIGSAFGLRSFDIPFVGLYGACSTMGLSMIMAALSVESGISKKALAVTSSHFCSAERQFRFPLEYGGQRTPTAQWTVTGSGAVILTDNLKGPIIKRATIGKIIDLGIKDMNNMGAAMAPAAFDTINRHFKATETSCKDYDAIFTGDLGKVGSDLLLQIAEKENVRLDNHKDCGLMIFDRNTQDVHAGGSGCGCSASVLCSFILKRFLDGAFKKVLFCPTGALMSPTSGMQGESIPGICHAIEICSE